MGNYLSDLTHSQFHTKYLKKALEDKFVRYSKSNPSGVATQDYLDQVLARIDSTIHLSSFLKLFNHLRNL